MPTPQLAWDFNGTTKDYVTGLDGTTTGTVTYNSSGKYGQSLIMNGSSYVKYSKTLGYNLGTGGASFTMWFKLLAFPVGTNFWIFGASGTSYSDRIYIFVSTTGYISFAYIDNTLAGKGLNSPSPLVIGAWNHLTFTLFNGTMVMYINGSQVATRSDAPMSGVILDTQFSIAALAGGSGNNINAEYDDLRIYKTALTAAQVKAIYNQQGMPGRAVNGNTQVPIASMIGQTFSPVNTRTPLPDTSVAGQISITSAATNYTTQGPVALTPSTSGFSFSVVYKINTDVTNFSGPVCFLSSAGDCIQLNMAFNLTSLVARKFVATTPYTYASTTVTSSGVVYYATVVVNTTGYVYLYLNGSLVSSGTSDTNKLPNTTYTCYLGTNRFLGLGDYTIYDFFAVNATLSASQVAAIYQKQLANINYNPGNTINWIPASLTRS